ncbi:MAG: hypothetical protein QOG10_450 [Kribbellaceae bacterium]|nr:hypothetical protein [Kribbellaceae bacterium]
MRFGVLGPLAVWTEDGEPVPIPEAKVRALLADLLTYEGRPVPPDRLIADVWGDRLPRNPAATLQTRVSQLRRALDAAEPGARDLVVRQPTGYQLVVSPDAVDAERFRALVARARATEAPKPRTTLLADALALWRGPAYAEYEFARSVAARLDEEQVTALGEHAQARLDLGEHHILATDLASLIANHPYCERLRAVHLRALYQAGRQSEALAAYEELRERLAEELGVDPSPELTALHRAILNQDPGLRPAPVRSATNLPAALTPLVGRARELAEVRDLLASERLVTLTGPGGVGKTALALEAARAAVSPTAYPGGVWWVDLTELKGDDPAAVRDLVAGSVGQEAPRAGQLLVLDTCEHVIEPVATVVDALLRTTTGLQILATSQESLAIPGERLLTVPPLDPSSAAELFTSRANLELTNENAIADICRRLDGLPLALELAAARVRTLGLTELHARLDDRFAVLATVRRGGLTRQQTLRATLDRSWNLLSAPEQAVLRRLSALEGEWTLATADEDDLEALARLVDRSLVLMTDHPDGARYRLLESTRAYALGAYVQSAAGAFQTGGEEGSDWSHAAIEGQ